MKINTYKGDDKTLTFYFKSSAGTAYDLTGCTVFFTVKRDTSDTDAAALISGTLTVSAPATGIGTFALTPTLTQYMLGSYKYDIQLKTAAGKIQTIIVDDFEVLPEVTIRTT